jgi:branched-chain amino acid transport system substrate-binding protein
MMGHRVPMEGIAMTASRSRTIARLVSAGLALASVFAAAADVKVGVLVSSTGPAAVIGVPQRNSVKLLPAKVGGVGVQYIVLDDGGDATSAVNNAKKLVAEEKVDALIGPSISPNAMAILGFVAEARTPLIAAVGTDAVIHPMDEQRRWVFKTAQANRLILQVEVDHMVRSHVRTLALLRVNDALGEEWAKALEPIIERAGIKLVAQERFQRSDISIAAQAIRIVAAKPDAVLVAAAGGTSALGQQSLVEKGFRGRIYQTNGAATDEFIRLASKSAEGALMAAGPIQVVDQLDDGNAIKKVALDYIAGYEKAYGSKPSSFGSNVYDAGLLLQAALPRALSKASPGTDAFREALREAIESTKGVVGTQGVFNLNAEDHNGMDRRAALMMTVRDGRWVVLK